MPLCGPVSVSVLSLFVRIPVILDWGYPKDLASTWLPLWRPYFQIRSSSCITGLEDFNRSFAGREDGHNSTLNILPPMTFPSVTYSLPSLCITMLREPPLTLLPTFYLSSPLFFHSPIFYVSLRALVTMSPIIYFSYESCFHLFQLLWSRLVSQCLEQGLTHGRLYQRNNLYSSWHLEAIRLLATPVW